MAVNTTLPRPSRPPTSRVPPPGSLQARHRAKGPCRNLPVPNSRSVHQIAVHVLGNWRGRMSWGAGAGQSSLHTFLCDPALCLRRAPGATLQLTHPSTCGLDCWGPEGQYAPPGREAESRPGAPMGPGHSRVTFDGGPVLVPSRLIGKCNAD